MWVAAGVLAGVVGLSCVGRLSSDGMVTVSSSGTREVKLTFGRWAGGYATVTDPSGFAIPFPASGRPVIDPASQRQLSQGGVPLLFGYHTTELRNLHGGTVTIFGWFVSYLPWAALAMLVLLGHAAAASYRQLAPVLAAARVARARRRTAWRQVLDGAGERCPACGYDLRTSADTCPECGGAFVRRTVILPAPRPAN
jgi:hypothetical protein